MKIRQGFVSNSSSSSFIVAVPTGTEVTAEGIMDLFMIPETSPVYDLNYSIADFIASAARPTSIPDLLSDYGYKTVEEALEDGCGGDLETVVQYAAEGFDVYRFHASDDNGDGVETMLCNTELDIHTEGLVLVGGRGY